MQKCSSLSNVFALDLIHRFLVPLRCSLTYEKTFELTNLYTEPADLTVG